MFSKELLFLIGCFGLFNIACAEKKDVENIPLQNLTKDSLSQIIAQNQSVFVLFYSDRCENCDEWRKNMKELSQNLKNAGMNDVVIAETNCCLERELCDTMDRKTKCISDHLAGEDKPWNTVDVLNKCNQVGMNDINVIRAASIEECSIKCVGFPMFAYGTNDFGANGCEDGLCKCHCLMGLDEAACQRIKYDEYWIFTYKEQPEWTFDLKVDCGGHAANSCSDCPLGHGSKWCNGDCVWTTDNGGQCISTGNSDCQWGSWGAWTECSSTCQGGVRKSVRKIKMEAKGDGSPCGDSYVREDVCNRQNCHEWLLVGERTECDGSNINLDFLSTIEDCATKCKEHASMFAYGTNDFGGDRCQSEGCKCLCETAASTNGTCTEINHDGYRLFKYKFTDNSPLSTLDGSEDNREIEEIEHMIYGEGKVDEPIYESTINVVPNVDYNVKIEVLRNDLGEEYEKVSEIAIDGVVIGDCNPDGDDYDCTFFDCQDSIQNSTITSETGSILVALTYQNHSWDCDCDKETWACSKENENPTWTPMTAVARITLSPANAYVHVADKKECDDSKQRNIAYPQEEGLKTVYDCAMKCVRQSSMFAFGTNSFGSNRCNDKGCRCLCELSASAEGTCTQVETAVDGGFYLIRHFYVGRSSILVSEIT